MLNTVLKKDPKILLIKKPDPFHVAVLVVFDKHLFVHVYYYEDIWTDVA